MQAQQQISGFSGAMRGTALQQQQRAPAARSAAPRLEVQAATITTRKLKPSAAPKSPPPPPKRVPAPTSTGTKKIKAGTAAVKPAGTSAVGGTRKVTAIEVFSKEKIFRAKQADARPAPKVLARIEQLRLLSKLEQSGLLSLAEKSGVTLSGLEQSGLLSTAEKLGVLGLVGDRNFPGTLYTLAAALLAAGPVAVYLLPDDSPALIAAQVLLAVTCVAGGSAAWGGASLLSSLQKS